MVYSGCRYRRALTRCRMSQLLALTIPGRPRPQGSMKTFAVKGRSMARHSDSTLSHRAHLISTIAAEWDREPFRDAVELTVSFHFARPKSHFRTGRNAHLLKDTAPKRHTQPPDVDKLIRLVGDALEMAGVIANDSQIVFGEMSKWWSNIDSTHLRLVGTDSDD